MKNKVKGGFLTYILLFLGLILGVGVIIMSILILSPGTKIFGFKYINNNNQVSLRLLPDESKTLEDAFNDKDFYTIKVDTENYFVEEKEYISGMFDINVVRSSAVNAFTIQIDNKSKGFTNSDEANKSEYEYTLNNDVLTLTMKDAHYNLALSKHISVNILIPNTSAYDINVINLDLKTSTGDINLGDTKHDLKLREVKCETTTGDIVVSEKASLIRNINLKSVDGDLLIKNDLDDFAFNLVELESQTGKIKTKSISGRLSITSKKSICEIDGDITRDLNYASEYGLIKAKNIGGSFYAEESVKISEITLGKIAGDVTFTSGKSSNVTIDEVGRVIYIKTESGNINIKNITGNFNHEIITKTGDVSYVNNSSGSIVVKTEKGKINAEYKKLDKVQNIENKSGKTNITISKSLPTKINLTTSGDIVCNFLGGEVKTGNYMQELNNPTELQVINVTATNGGDIFFTEKVS